MSQQVEARNEQVALFLNPVARRRGDFQSACGHRFGRLLVAEHAAQAAYMCNQEHVDLLIIDLEHFERGIDRAALGALVAQRAGAPVLLVCRWDAAGWLAELMAFGPLGYVIGPVTDAELNRRLGAPPTAADGADPRTLLALRSRFQQAVDGDDQAGLAARACAALGGWPGVLHAALFERNGTGALALAAQYPPARIDLAALAPAFPGLLAASTGEFVCIDAPEKAGDAALSITLRNIGAAMVVGVPILARGPAAPAGALSVMFERAHCLSPEELATLADLAQLAGFGLRLAAMQQDGEQLRARLTDLAVTDALTGVANRLRGEALLEQEIKRARRYQTPLALIAFDVDHFKAINDRFGHPCGDAALRIVAATTCGQLRSSDLAARTGGDQFQIVATHTNAIDALNMAEKIRAAIAATAFPGCDRLTVSLAVGQAAAEESADSLMLRVNAALARAKRAGRNCVELARQ
jgi:diguanylate cyclase (GGDEF)-like protein